MGKNEIVTGADRLVEALVALGVDVVFGLPGVHNLSIWEAIAATDIRLVGVRHEQTAAYAADGYARATGKLGVALVTTGPGAANTVTATGEAWTVGSPIMIIATDIPTTIRQPGVFRGVLHECRDQAAMFGPVVKYAHTVASADGVGEGLLHAAAVALGGAPGPVYLGLPIDTLTDPAPTALMTPASLKTRASNPVWSRNGLPVTVSSADRAGAVAILKSAARPLIWAGGGSIASGASAAVQALAERLNAPVLTSYGGKGILPSSHPLVVNASVLVKDVEALWDQADVVIAIGTDFDAMMTRGWGLRQPTELLVINIDADDAAKNYAPTLTLEGDARTIIEDLLPDIEQRDGRQFVVDELRAIEDKVWSQIRAESPDAADMLDTLHQVLPDDGILIVDMCVAGYWSGGFHRVSGPRKFAYPVGWGTLGFGFPASLGSAAANVGPVVALVGDGGFLYACGDLATMAQEQLPVTLVIIDDGGYGMLRFGQIHAGLETRGVDLLTPDFDMMVRAFGLPVTTMVGFGQPFADALAAGIASAKPNVIVVKAKMMPPPTTSVRWVPAVERK
jgi:thiamine pyrophosphate-dependent acetolactate synthase large subunit-like protein